MIAVFTRLRENWRRAMEQRRERALQRHEDRSAGRRSPSRSNSSECSTKKPLRRFLVPDPAITQRTRKREPEPVAGYAAKLPWEDPAVPVPVAVKGEALPAGTSEIPICQLAETPDPGAANLVEFLFTAPLKGDALPKRHTIYRSPWRLDLLNEIPVRSAFDEQELKNTAAAIKASSKSSPTPRPRWCRSIRPQRRTTFEFAGSAGISAAQPHHQPRGRSLPGLQAELIPIERILAELPASKSRIRSAK